MESNIPKYDLPVDYIVGEGFAKDLLKSYKNFPCKIESGLFIPVSYTHLTLPTKLEV